MESLIKLVKMFPILPFNYDKNRRGLVNIENLMYLTALVIDKEASGVFLPLDEKNISLKEIVEGIEKAYNLKRINIPMIQPIFWLLTKVKPNIMVRLFGTLQFDNRLTKEKLGYIAKVRYVGGIK